MRVDLHCHTKSTKKGDGDGRNVTKDLFVQKVSDADVKIVAITNHNAFDIKQSFFPHYLNLKLISVLLFFRIKLKIFLKK